MTTETKIKLAELCGKEIADVEHGEVFIKYGPFDDDEIWSPDTNPAQLMECVEALDKKEYYFEIQHEETLLWSVFIFEPEADTGMSPLVVQTAPALTAAIAAALTELVREKG